MTSAVKKIQRKSFISRDNELEFIEKGKISALAKGAILFQCITTITGIPGIGKTTLLKKVAEIAESFKLRWIQVSLGKNLSRKREEFFLFKEIAKLFEENDASEANRQIDEIHKMGQEERRMDQEGRRRFLNLYAKHLKKYLEAQPLILMVDDSHRLNETEKAIFEGIMERVCGTNRLLVVLAGRSYISWRSFELRRRTFQISLDHFDKEQFDNFLIAPRDDQLNDRIYRLTRGYPLASVQALEWVGENLNVTDPEFHQKLTDRETDLVLSLTDTILDNFILIDIPSRENRNLLKALLKYTSPLRRFDDGILSKLLKEVIAKEDSAVHPEKSSKYFWAMKTLTHLVVWDSPKTGYATDAAVRRLLALSMKYREKDIYLAIHEYMANFYKKAMNAAIEKDPSSPQSILYLLEFIFHHASFHAAKGEIQTWIEDIRSIILENFKGYKFRERNHFYEEYKKDEDIEELMGEEYPGILEIIKDHLQ